MKYRLSGKRARRDLLQSSDTSLKQRTGSGFLDRLIETFRLLGNNPQVGRRRDDLLPGYRSLPIGIHDLLPDWDPRCLHHACSPRLVGFWKPSVCSEFTNYRATLFFVEENRNITLSLPRELLRQIKRLAAERDTSVSAMMVEALKRMADEDRRYSAARKQALAALRSACSLGTGGRRTWLRDDLHTR
jgi:hypothetical protein